MQTDARKDHRTDAREIGGMTSATLAGMLRNCRDLPLRFKMIRPDNGAVICEDFVKGEVDARDDGIILMLNTVTHIDDATTAGTLAGLLDQTCKLLVAHGQDCRFHPTVTGTAIGRKMQSARPCCVLSMVHTNFTCDGDVD